MGVTASFLVARVVIKSAREWVHDYAVVTREKRERSQITKVFAPPQNGKVEEFPINLSEVRHKTSSDQRL